MKDKRIAFFLIAAVLCTVMTPLAPTEYRWVPAVTAVAYVGLAVLVLMESFSRRSGGGPE